MPYPALAKLNTYVTTGQFHDLQEIFPGIGLSGQTFHHHAEKSSSIWIKKREVWWRANIYLFLVDVELLPHLDTMVKTDIPNYDIDRMLCLLMILLLTFKHHIPKTTHNREGPHDYV